MREIKFRGKSKKTGKWVYGYYFKDFNKKSYIINILQEIQNANISNVWIEVLEETVGQFTGLCDENNKEIYEGDILKNKDGLDIVKFHDGCFLVVNEFDEHFENADILFNYMPVELEVIGNVYDNPELLKEGD